jgi:hypothetical protein
MEIFLLGALGLGAFLLAKKGVQALSSVSAAGRFRRGLLAAAQQRAAARAGKRREQLRRANVHARNLQLALLQLDRATDFRRAATWAAQAKDVPLAFRQRQFRRFRPHIVGYMAARLQAGADAEGLTQSLALLLQHLGIASYEAEYIRTEAERSLVRQPAPDTELPFEQQVQALQRQHAQRMEALRRLPDLEEEMRERLLETEEHRFQEALLQLGDGSAGDAGLA